MTLLGGRHGCRVAAIKADAVPPVRRLRLHEISTDYVAWKQTIYPAT